MPTSSVELAPLAPVGEPSSGALSPPDATPSQSAASDPDADLEAAQRLAAGRVALRREIAKRIVGQHDVVDALLVALFSRGHCLLVGVPGLAKTRLISTLADVLRLTFNRIQFTPDLMPSDITGTDVLEEDGATGRRSFRFLPGPLFANLVLADEINRTPPKTQAALLQAMQEHRVTASGVTHELAPPFLVLATQNPIEQEGTYPLPEAQLDRFMFELDVDYPSEEDELEIVRRSTGGPEPAVDKVLAPGEILALQQLVWRVPAAEHVVRYAVALTRATRPDSPGAPSFIRDHVTWGAGPRASLALLLGAKAKALLEGRFAAAIEDVRALARPTLQHRLVRSFQAEADGVRARELVDRLVETLPPP